MRELVLDTETTGLDPKDNHRIIEFACVELVNFIPTGKTWHWYFNPERDVPKASVEVHGLTAAFLADKPLFSELAAALRDIVAGARLVIHNAAFDMGFINHEFDRCSLSPIGFENVVDTLALARRKHPGSPNSLDALCRRYGVDNSSRKKHGALLDCELLADVYIRLMGAEQAGLNFAVEIAAGGEAKMIEAVSVRSKPLPPRLNEAEIEAHRQFVATLGDKAIWPHLLDEEDRKQAA